MDSFRRQVSDGWGSAEVGGSYSLSGPAVDFDVTGAARDVDLTVRVATNKLPAGASQNVYLVARRVSSSSEYRGRIRFGTDGRLLAVAEQDVTGTILVSISVQYAC